MKNETPNERNFRLLKERFLKEDQLIPSDEVEDIVVDGTGTVKWAYYENEPLYPVTNENGIVIGFEPENEHLNKNEIVFKNELGNENELGIENENETRNGNGNGNELKMKLKNKIKNIL